MSKSVEELINNLNNDVLDTRLSALKTLKNMIDDGSLPTPKLENNVNNHIHTWYSFSPYSPTKALWMAYQSGLETAGIMDHDSVAGAKEFIESGQILGMKTTVGVECRVNMRNTKLNGLRINNPDEKSIAYIALHGIPHTQLDIIASFFKPYSKERNIRNELMVQKINDLVKDAGVSLDFENDVKPISKFNEGGSITERHLLFALANKFISKYGKGKALVDLLKDKLQMNLSSKNEAYLLDEDNEFYNYDLLGVFKSDLVSKFYIPTTKECPDVKDVIELSNKTKAISAYAYLGDVKNSVTGDKKAQAFEDSYLPMLFEVLKDLKFNAVTYMPSRNTPEQLATIQKFCQSNNFMEISGEDINSPRQSFICEALKKPECANLFTATYALINHEKRATINLEDALFSSASIEKEPNVIRRIEEYAKN